MAGSQTQGWDVVIEFNEPAITRQVSLALANALAGMGTPPFAIGEIAGGVNAALDPGSMSLKFVPGRGDLLRLLFLAYLNGVSVPYMTIGRDAQLQSRRINTFTVGAFLNLEREGLAADEATIMAAGREFETQLGSVGLTVARVRDLAAPLMIAVKNFIRRLAPAGTTDAVIPLSSGIPASFRVNSRVVTDSSRMGERAFQLFISAATAPPAVTDMGRVHLQGPAADRTAVVVRNDFLAASVLCPALNMNPCFTPSPGLMFTGPGRCTSTVMPGFRICGTPALLLVTGMTLQINDAAERFVLSGTFNLVVPTLWGDGTFSMSFGVRWNGTTVVIAGTPVTDARVNVHAWVWLVSALLFGVIFGLIGAAAGPIGAVIGGVVGAAAGIAAVHVVEVIATAVARGATASTAAGFVGTSLFPLPLLVPTALMPQDVRLDDLTIVSQPQVASVQITGSLAITRREVLSSSGLGTRTRLTWGGEFVARPTNLTVPLRFSWTLNGRPLSGEGEMTVARGSIRFRVDGARCHLTTTPGTFLTERLCVEVRDSSNFGVVSCRTLRGDGERTEIEELPIPPDYDFSQFRFPPNLIPDPAPDVFLDAQQLQTARADFAAAVVRGMGVPPDFLEKLGRQ